jgi:hypothetical protein
MELVNACDGWCSENFLLPHQLEAETWRGYLNLIDAITSSGKIVVTVTPVTLAPKREEDFYFTSCLLTDAIFWRVANRTDPNWDKFSYAKIKLGFPKGTRYELERYPGVWAREYDLGLVLVNSNKYPIDLAVPYQNYDLAFQKVNNSYDTKDNRLYLESCAGEICLRRKSP